MGTVAKHGPIVLLAAPGASSNTVYHALRLAFEDVRVVLERPISRRQLLWRRVRRLGPLTVVGQVLFQMLVVPALTRASARRARDIREQSGLDDSPIEGAAITEVASVNSARTVDVVRHMKPSVVVVNGTRILGAALLAAVDVPIINMHAGITPAYRGVHGGYWALAEGDRAHSGVTVHRIDLGIDTGPVLGQATIAPTAADSFATYPLLQLAAGIPLLIQAVREACRGASEPMASGPAAGRLWTHPTLWGYLWIRFRRGVR